MSNRSVETESADSSIHVELLICITCSPRADDGGPRLFSRGGLGLGRRRRIPYLSKKFPVCRGFKSKPKLHKAGVRWLPDVDLA